MRFYVDNTPPVTHVEWCAGYGGSLGCSLQVFGGCPKKHRVVASVAQHEIAISAKQPADPFILMTMIHVHSAGALWAFADCTRPSLALQKRGVRGFGESVFAFPIAQTISFWRARLERAICLLPSKIIALPLSDLSEVRRIFSSFTLALKNARFGGFRKRLPNPSGIVLPHVGRIANTKFGYCLSLVFVHSKKLSCRKKLSTQNG